MLTGGIIMCTNITLKSSDNKFLMARTMDFSFELSPEMAVFGRNVPLKFDVADVMNEHYAFMGLAKDVGTYYVADGINEFGLTGAALYFEGYAHYESPSEHFDTMVAPHEVVMWMLASCKTVDDVVSKFKEITIVEHVMGFLGVIPPLHWTFLDTTGHSVVVEITENGIHFENNALGVLTNSPDYNWHLTNVRNYIGLDPNQRENRTIYGMEFKPFGQGSGTFGLPGDFTSPSRFIKTLYNKLSLQKSENADELVLNAMHVLNAVDIPKGSVITQRHTIDYTQYTSYMVNNDHTYFYRMHDSLNVKRVALANYDLDSHTINIVE